MHDLSLVVRAPAGQASELVASLGYRNIFPGQWGWMLASGIADLILAAKIRRRFAGIVPYRATLPPSARRIDLPA